MGWKDVKRTVGRWWKKGGDPAFSSHKHHTVASQQYQDLKFDISDDRRYVINSSAFGRQDFKDLETRVPELTELGIKGRDRMRHFRELQVDAYEWFYKGAPRNKEGTEFYADFQPHQHLLQMMSQMSEYRTLKQKTIRNKLASTLAVKLLNNMLGDMPSDVVDSIGAAQQEGEASRQSIKRLNALRKTWADANASGDKDKLGKLEEMGKELQKVAEEDKQTAAAAAQEAAQDIEKNADNIKDALRDALDNASSEISDIKKTMQNFSFGQGAGEITQLNQEKLLKMSGEISKSVEAQRIAEISGRIKEIIQKKTENETASECGEIVEIELGSDISRLVGSEYAALANDDLELDLIRRLHDEQATVWKSQDPDTLGKGPIICAVDTSGSMSGYPIHWAKAVACVLYQACKQRQQPFHMVQFSHLVDSVTFQPDGKDDDKFWDMLTTFEGGGTHYDKAWAEIKRLFSEKSELSRADVVFISDEEFPVRVYQADVDEFRQCLEETGSQCYGIGIIHYDQVAAPTSGEAFREFCHASWALKLPIELASWCVQAEDWNFDKVNVDKVNDDDIIQEMFVDNILCKHRSVT